jgi:hypothetical protein
MDPIEPADFKGFYRSLDAESKKRFAASAKTTIGNIETHWVYARKIPGPTRMERLYATCVEFGAQFTKAQIIAFFYEPNKDRAIKSKDAVDKAAASDDVQPPVGGIKKDSKLARASAIS